MSKYLSGFLLCFIFIFPCWADQLIIEPDMGRAPILNAINNAQHSIELVMYGFTDEQLLNAIAQQKIHGKTVKIILERHPFKANDENNKAVAKLDTDHITWQGSLPPLRFIHEKALIIDGHKAIIMTFNFTHATFKKERNFGLIIDDPQRVQEIAAIFSGDWNHHPTETHLDNLIWSPDNSRSKLLSLIDQAKNSIAIYAQNINDYKIIGALAKAARKGITVKILTSQKMREKQENYLGKAGVNIHYCKTFMIHAKVFIIDQKKAAIGSINLTHGSLDDNRELSVITQDSSVIKQLSATFNNDWNNANNATITKHPFVLDKRTIKRGVYFIKKYGKYTWQNS